MPARARRKKPSTAASAGARSRFIQNLVLIAGIALTLRLLYLAGAAHNPLYLSPALDGRVNDQQGWAIASGRPTDVSPSPRAGDAALGAQPYFRPPGYGHFLAAVYSVAGHDLRAPRVAQALLGALSVILLGLIGASLWDTRVGCVAAALGAVFGPSIYFEGELVSASLELFLALLAVWTLIEAEKRRRTAWFTAAGIALTLGAVTRPTVLPFAAVAVAWLLARRVPARAVAVFAATALSLPIACTLRNAVVAHDPVFIASQGGINFYIGNHAGADGTTPNVPGLGSGVTATYDAPFREASRLAGRTLKASEVSSFWFARGAEFWRADPVGAAWLFVKKIAMVWNRRELPNTQDQAFFAPFNSWIFRGPWHLTFAVVAPFALVAAWFERRRAVALLLFAATLTVVTAAFFVCDRFRLPLVVAIIPLAAAAVTRVWDFARRRGEAPSLGAAAQLRLGALAVAAVALIWLPFPHWQSKETGMSWFRLASAYEQTLSDGNAARAYEHAAHAGLATPELYNNYGLLALRQGDLAAAARRLQRAIAIDSLHGPALANLAEVYLRQGDTGRAADAYAAAARAIPEQAPELLTNAGALYQRTHQVSAARAAYSRALELRPGFTPAAEGLRSLGSP